MKSTKSSLLTETIGAAASIARKRKTRMKDGGRGCRRSKKNFPPWRPFSGNGVRGEAHFGVTITPTILSFITPTSILASSAVVPLSTSNSTVNELRLGTLS
jgi:hypothetical protein